MNPPVFVTPWWANGRVPGQDRIVSIIVKEADVVAIGESGRQYVIGHVEDVYPLPGQPMEPK